MRHPRRRNSERPLPEQYRNHLEAILWRFCHESAPNDLRGRSTHPGSHSPRQWQQRASHPKWTRAARIPRPKAAYFGLKPAFQDRRGPRRALLNKGRGGKDDGLRLCVMAQGKDRLESKKSLGIPLHGAGGMHLPFFATLSKSLCSFLSICEFH